MKSKAPRRVALTAVSTVPWPEIMITGRSGERFLTRSSTARPSMPGSHTSNSIRSGDSRSSRPSALSPSAASSTS